MSVNVNKCHVIILLFPQKKITGTINLRSGKMFTALAKKLISEGKIIERYTAVNDTGMKVYAFHVEYMGKQYIVIRHRNGTAELIARKF